MDLSLSQHRNPNTIIQPDLFDRVGFEPSQSNRYRRRKGWFELKNLPSSSIHVLIGFAFVWWVVMVISCHSWRQLPQWLPYCRERERERSSYFKSPHSCLPFFFTPHRWCISSSSSITMWITFFSPPFRRNYEFFSFWYPCLLRHKYFFHSLSCHEEHNKTWRDGLLWVEKTCCFLCNVMAKDSYWVSDNSVHSDWLTKDV